MTKTGRAPRFLEAVAFGLIHKFGPKALVLALAAVGLTVPTMPLLRYTYIAFAFIVLLALYLRSKGEPLATFGLIVPRRCLLIIGLGVALAVAQILLGSLVRSLTTPLIIEWTGADPDLDAKTFSAIKGDTALFAIILPCVWLFAGLGEEFLYRGYFMTRIWQVLGQTRLAWAAAIVLQAVLFALAHWYQGPVNMVPIGVVAVFVGITTVAWGRNLWPAIFAHALVDTLGFTMLYLGMPI